MASFNSTAQEFGFLTLRQHTVFDDTMRIARFAAAALLALLNASIAIAFLVQKVRRPVRVSPSGLLVLNLVLADAFLGAALTVLTTRMTTDPQRCGIWTGVLFFATVGSNCALINVVLDRFIAIAYTLQHRVWMSAARSKVMVLCGWSVPLTGLVYGFVSNDWSPGPARLCPHIRSVGTFLRCAWFPADSFTTLCVIVIQCCVYLHLRRHDAERVTCNSNRSSSHKAARLLFWVMTPACAVRISYDVVVIIIAPRLNWVLRFTYTVMLLFVELSFLANPVVYSYATANIKKPVSDLFKDITVWMSSSKRAEPTPQRQSVFYLEPKTYPNP